MLNSIKRDLAVVCFSIVGLSGIAGVLGQKMEQAQARARAAERREQELAAENLHHTDLRPLYEEINLASFDGMLPVDVPVSWANLSSNRYCGNCGGMTDWDSGSPAIRLNTATVKTEKGMRELLQHEMCHVAVNDEAIRIGQDAHGPLFQECMKRFR